MNVARICANDSVMVLVLEVLFVKSYKEALKIIVDILPFLYYIIRRIG